MQFHTIHALNHGARADALELIFELPQHRQQGRARRQRVLDAKQNGRTMRLTPPPPLPTSTPPHAHHTASMVDVVLPQTVFDLFLENLQAAPPPMSSVPFFTVAAAFFLLNMIGYVVHNKHRGSDLARDLEFCACQYASDTMRTAVRFFIITSFIRHNFTLTPLMFPLTVLETLFSQVMADRHERRPIVGMTTRQQLGNCLRVTIVEFTGLAGALHLGPILAESVARALAHLPFQSLFAPLLAALGGGRAIELVTEPPTVRCQ